MASEKPDMTFDAGKEPALFSVASDSSDKEVAAKALHEEFCSLTKDEQIQTVQALATEPVFGGRGPYNLLSAKLLNGKNELVGLELTSEYNTLFVDTRCPGK